MDVPDNQPAVTLCLALFEGLAALFPARNLAASRTIETDWPLVGRRLVYGHEKGRWRKNLPSDARGGKANVRSWLNAQGNVIDKLQPSAHLHHQPGYTERRRHFADWSFLGDVCDGLVEQTACRST